jgi:hypothetical protein
VASDFFTRQRLRFHKLWDPCIGQEASELRYLDWKLRAYLFCNAIIIAVTAISAGVAKTDPVHILLVALAATAGAGQLALIGYVFALRNRQYAAASEYLSVKVTARNFPSPNRTAFAKWCRRNRDRPGLAENAAGRFLTNASGESTRCIIAALGELTRRGQGAPTRRSGWFGVLWSRDR